MLLQGILEARKILKKIIDEYKLIERSSSKIAIFSKGGPGSVAIGIAAWTLNIPLYIHESDTIPGRSNQLLGKIATKIFLGFKSTKQYFDEKKCEVVGQILSTSFVKEVPEGRRISSEKIPPTPLSQGGPNWKTDKKHVLVICGSQGARSIFEAILGQFSDENPYEWIISLGKLNGSMKSDFENIQNIQAFEWIDQKDIASLLGNTDITITRGSATTLAEIDIFGVRKIIIPLPSAAKNHQYWNAREYEQK